MAELGSSPVGSGCHGNRAGRVFVFGADRLDDHTSHDNRALVGGAIGGAIASRVPAKLLRWIVIVAGLGMSAAYFARL